jgi:hypothetical protein
MYPCFVCVDDAMSAFPEDVQQFEKSILDRSRGRSQTTAKVAAVKEDDSEKDKGTDSEKDKDEDEDDYAPKKRPVSPMSIVSRPL